jgi:hypothetical protein
MEYTTLLSPLQRASKDETLFFKRNISKKKKNLQAHGTPNRQKPSTISKTSREALHG